MGTQMCIYSLAHLRFLDGQVFMLTHAHVDLIHAHVRNRGASFFKQSSRFSTCYRRANGLRIFISATTEKSKIRME